MADAYVSYFDDDTKRKEAEDVRAMVRLDETEEEIKEPFWRRILRFFYG